MNKERERGFEQTKAVDPSNSEGGFEIGVRCRAEALEWVCGTRRRRRSQGSDGGRRSQQGGRRTFEGNGLGLRWFLFVSSRFLFEWRGNGVGE